MITAVKSLIKILKSNIHYRKQSLKMARMTLDKMYSGSTLGVIWALVNPILFILVYWFGMQIGIRGGKAIAGHIPYIFWMMSGIIAWFFIRDILQKSIGCIRRDRHLVTKVVFPVDTIPVYSTMALFFIHLVLFAIVFLVLAIFGYFPDIYYLQFIYYIGFMFIFGCILSTFLSTLSVISLDFQNLVRTTSMIFFWLSPVLWSADRAGHILQVVIKLNPFYYFIQGYRDTFLYKIWFWERPHHTLYMILFTIVFGLITAYLYEKLHGDFSDVL